MRGGRVTHAEEREDSPGGACLANAATRVTLFATVSTLALRGNRPPVKPPEPDVQRELAMLRILYGACAAALDAFRAADNALDAQLTADLEAMVERTQGEIERLSAQIAKAG